MESASHAHVPDYRETAPERKAAQLDVRRVRVIRIRVSDELGYERLLTLPRGRLTRRRCLDAGGDPCCGMLRDGPQTRRAWRGNCEAGAPADTQCEREARPAAQKYVEAVIILKTFLFDPLFKNCFIFVLNVFIRKPSKNPRKTVDLKLASKQPSRKLAESKQARGIFFGESQKI